MLKERRCIDTKPIHSLEDNNEPLTLKGYMEAITAWFSTWAHDYPMFELKDLIQTGTIQAYLDEFDLIWNKVGISKSLALSVFLGEGQIGTWDTKGSTNVYIKNHMRSLHHSQNIGELVLRFQ